MTLIKQTMHDTDLGLKSGASECFVDAFSRLIKLAFIKDTNRQRLHMKASCIDTKLGSMIAISDDKELYLLEFTDSKAALQKIERLILKKRACVKLTSAAPINMIKKELELYFLGKLREFKTPLHLVGSEFQKRAWGALIETPYGQTRSYLEQAGLAGNEKALRAVASANGANKLAIIVPCHRIINHSGKLGGYAGGLSRKEWLINHEKQHAEHF